MNKCTKLKLTKQEALKILKDAKVAPQFRKEKRKYYCKECKAFHTTSKDFVHPLTRKPVKLLELDRWTALLNNQIDHCMTPKEELLKQMHDYNDGAFAINLKSRELSQKGHQEALTRLLDWFETNGKDLNQIPMFVGQMIRMFLGRDVIIDEVKARITGGSIIGAPFFSCTLELMPMRSDQNLGSGFGFMHRIDFMNKQD